MHDEIKKFSLEGELGEPNIVVTKERLINQLENLMRDYSYVPSLDLEPQFTLDYSEDKQSFNFTLTVYGVRVENKEKAWKTSGITNGNAIQRYTPQSKSKQS